MEIDIHEPKQEKKTNKKNSGMKYSNIDYASLRNLGK